MNIAPKQVRRRPRPVARSGSYAGRAMTAFRESLRPFIPMPLRLQFRRLMMHARQPSAGPLTPDTSAHCVTVLGFHSAPTGLGEGARLHASTLADLGYTVGIIDVSALIGVPGGVELPSGRPEIVHGDVGGPIICHLNPPDFEQALYRLRLSGRRRKLIAYWAWELPTIPEGWSAAFRLVHEIWVPSRFVADAVKQARCEVPIRVVPHPIRPQHAQAPRHAQTPKRAGPDLLKVLTVFAYESGFDRKNPLAAIAAFREAFGDREDVRLTIKVRGKSLSGEPERRLAEHLRGARNIEVMDRELDPAGMIRLYADADVLLSLHRAEGFGIPMAAAMLMAKPVVATAWSGNLEFMSDTSACLVPATMISAQDENEAYAGLNTMWADPSIPAAAQWLRRLEDPFLRQQVGEAAKTHASQRLGVAAFATSVTPGLES